IHTFAATLTTVGVQSISVTDTVNAAITGMETGISVVQLTASISGSSIGVPGQSLSFTLGGSESASTIYSYSVQWGDGSSVETFTGPSGTQVSHTFVTPGAFSVAVTATDPSSSASLPASTLATISAVVMETDPYNPSLTALYVGGTLGDDTIAVTPVTGSGVKVAMNMVSYGTFYPTGHVLAFGQSG